MTATLLSDVDQDVADFCVEARDDHVGLWQIARRAADRNGANEAAREQALAIVRRLLAVGLRAGNLTGGGDFAPWPGQEPDFVVDRIRREWIALGRDPSINEIAWFGLPRG